MSITVRPLSLRNYTLCATLLLLGLLIPGIAEASGPCANTPPIARTPTTGSPFGNTPGVTLMETQTSDNVRVTGGCVDATIGGQLYAAASYKGAVSKAHCKWTATEDVGDCINAAIAAASANGGGTVLLPAGSFGLTTTINLASKVKLHAAGGGGFDVCATKLTWIGAADGTMVQIGSGSSADIITNTGLDGVCLHGGPGIAGTGIEMWNTTHSTFRNLLILNVKTRGWFMDTSPTSTSNILGNTFVDVSIQNCNALSVNADGWVIGPGTDTQDVARNTWIGGITNNAKGRAFVWGGSDANTMFGGAYQPCAAGRTVAASAVVSAAGSAYTNGDVVTVPGCTAAPGVSPTFTLTVAAGTVTAAAVNNSGWCPSTPPANPVAVTGGTGTGLTLTVTYDLGSGYGMVFSGQPYDSGEHSRGNMLFGTIVGAGGVGGVYSEAGAPGFKAAQDNVLYGRKTEDGEPSPVCQANPADVTFTGDTHTSTTIDGIASTAGLVGGTPGQSISGTDIPTGTTIVSVAANSIVISQAATGSSVGGSFTATQPDVSSFRWQDVDGNMQACDNGEAGKWRLNKGNIVLRVVSKTADYAVVSTGDNSGYLYNNTGAVAPVTFTLPAASGTGKFFCFEVTTGGQAITVQPRNGTDNIRLSSTIVSSNAPTGYVTASGAGAKICLADSASGSYRVLMGNGKWTTDIGTVVKWGNLAGLTTVGTNLSKSDDTLTTIPGMTMTLAAGVSYICNGHLSVSSSGAGGGIKVALTGDGTLSVTNMHLTATNWNGTTANARSTVTALATAAGGANAVVTDVDLAAGIVVNAGGVLSVQAAQNTTDATATVVRGTSTFGCREVD